MSVIASYSHLDSVLTLVFVAVVFYLVTDRRRGGSDGEDRWSVSKDLTGAGVKFGRDRPPRS